jgi:hypothetical protein
MATLDAFFSRVVVWKRSDMVRTTIPHGDEDEADDEEDPGCGCTDSRSCRCSNGKLAGGEFVEDGRHCRGEVSEVWDGDSEVSCRFERGNQVQKQGRLSIKALEM